MIINWNKKKTHSMSIEISRMAIKYFLSTLNIEPKKLQTYIPVFLSWSFLQESQILNNEFYSSSYQRLEFLWDALISSYVAEFLFKRHKEYCEWAYSFILSEITRNTTLSEIALELGIDVIIHRWDFSKLPKDNKIYADVFEALIWAIYLDKWNNFAKKFIQEYLINKTIKTSIEIYEKKREELKKKQEKNKSKKIKEVTV